MTVVGGEARRLRAALLEAPDAAVGRIVGMLDGLVHRGDADALLEGVRPRLRRLRPPRPLRLPRLLFLPLDGVLVAPGEWRNSPLHVPRNAILPIAAALREALPMVAEEVDVAALGHTLAEAAPVARLGARLWPEAGAARLPGLPPGWLEAGLPREAAAPVLGLCAAVWRHAPLLWQARDAAAQGAGAAALRAALAPLAMEGRGPLFAGMALLLRVAALPGEVAALAASLCPPIAALAESEMAALLTAEAAAVTTAATAAEIAENATRLDQRLGSLDQPVSPVVREARRRLAAMLRRDAAIACQARFAVTLTAALLAPAARAAAAPPAGDAVVAALETAARDLRRLELAGRGLGQETRFDATLHEAVADLARLAATPGGLTRVELARLAEILVGPEAALPMLG